MRIFFTGGSGKADRYAIEYLRDRGHLITNADLVPAGIDGVPDLRIDLTEAGQVFDALSSYARHDELADPRLRRRNIFAYIDARDLGHMVERCLLTDGLGYEVFNVANDDTSVAIMSAEVDDRFYDGVEQRREFEGYETFYANDKAKRLVGFAPTHSWGHLVDTSRTADPEG